MLLLPLRSCYPGPQVSEMGRCEDLQAEQGEGRTGGSEDWSSGGGMHNASRRDRGNETTCLYQVWMRP